MQPHKLHQHLVGIGRAVKCASAGAVIAVTFGLQQFLTTGFAFGEKLADARFFTIGQAGTHRAGRNENGRQIAKLQRAHEQTRHDFIAYAEIECGVECIMRQGYGGGHGNHIAREQRHFHTRLALRDAIAHGRHAAGHLRRCACLAGSLAYQFGIALIGLMR